MNFHNASFKAAYGTSDKLPASMRVPRFPLVDA